MARLYIHRYGLATAPRRAAARHLPEPRSAVEEPRDPIGHACRGWRSRSLARRRAAEGSFRTRRGGRRLIIDSRSLVRRSSRSESRRDRTRPIWSTTVGRSSPRITTPSRPRRARRLVPSLERNWCPGPRAGHAGGDRPRSGTCSAGAPRWPGRPARAEEQGSPSTVISNPLALNGPVSSPRCANDSGRLAPAVRRSGTEAPASGSARPG